MMKLNRQSRSLGKLSINKVGLRPVSRDMLPDVNGCGNPDAKYLALSTTSGIHLAMIANGFICSEGIKP